LAGAIPGTISKCIHLQYLLLNGNRLNGAIHSSIADLTDLDSLNFSGNKFTFEGMELIAQTFSFASYGNQARIPIHLNNSDNTLSVSAGGTLNNNTYQWHKLGEPGNTTIIKADSVFHPSESGILCCKSE
jgi:hypothetical protein